LSSAVMTDTNLADADLLGANLTDITSGGITGTPAALPLRWTLVEGYLVGPGAVLAGADLAGASMPDVHLAEADLAGANLTGTNLTASRLTHVNLAGGNLTDANLSGANLDHANLTGAVWNDTTCPDGINSSNDGGTCVNNLG